MKKLLILSILVIAFVFPPPTSTQSANCRQEVTWIRGGNCDSYWHRFSVPSYCPVDKSIGDGTWPWGNKTRVELPKVTIHFRNGSSAQSWGTGNHTVVKSNVCSAPPPSTSSGSKSPPKPTSVPVKILWTEMQRMGFEILRRIRDDLGIPDNIGEAWAAQYPPYSWEVNDVD